MFERICVLLLRLYPAGFRRAYGAESRQLIRDRAQHERGLFLRVLLLSDLIVDLLAVSMQDWESTASPLARVDAGPRFDIIEPKKTRPEAIAMGMLVTLLALASFTQMFGPRAFVDSPLTVGKGSGHEPPGFPSKDDNGQQTVVTSGDDRHDLIAAIAANLRERYYDRAMGQQLADAILTFEKDGRYKDVATGPDLAQKMTDDIHSTSNAIGIPKGMYVADIVYSNMLLPSGPPMAMPPQRNLEQRDYHGCLFESVEIQSGNIGYFKLNAFADGGCTEATAKAMASFNGVAALIIDLRDNGGGFGDLALQIAGYLFDRPAFLWDPRTGSPVPPRTASPVAGNKLANTPVFVLTSSRTQSAAEYFVYNLKMLKRVTVVGEKTAGHQHSGTFERITDHIGMGIQGTPPPDNPYAVKGWEVIGVDPDVPA